MDPAVVIEDLESQAAEEGGTVVLHCELSKPGLLVEWKKETLVLICGEKCQMKQTGLAYELQIFDLRPEDSGTYSCCSDDTISSASLIVNGRTQVFFLILFLLLSFLSYSSSHCFIILVPAPKINISLFLVVNQLLQFFSLKSSRVKRLMKGTMSGCTVSFPDRLLRWSGRKENLVFALVQNMTLNKRERWQRLSFVM